MRTKKGTSVAKQAENGLDVSAIQSLVAPQETTELLQKLVQIDSCNPPGGEEPAADLLAGFMDAAGMETELMPLAPGRANVIGRWRGTGARPAMLFCGHLDTVPADKAQWRHDPHAGIIDGDVLHGRGAGDMKSGVAAMVMACVAFARANVRLAGDLVFAGTAGEEVDCLGSRDLLEHDLGPISSLIIAEPTRLEVVVAHKGALWLEIVTKGKAAHGAFPDHGYNAITAMNRFLDRLEAYRPSFRPHALLSSPTLNVGTIQGGVKTNVVPDRCVLTIDLRSVPGQKHETLVQDVQGIIDALGREDAAFRASLRVVNDRPPVETATDHPLIQTATKIGREVFGRPMTPKGIGYYTDASILTPGYGVPTLLCGPGDESLAHQVDEWVDLNAVQASVRFYVALAQAFLSG
jgi:succinyl-diaminopimelate desuccinylase